MAEDRCLNCAAPVAGGPVMADLTPEQRELVAAICKDAFYAARDAGRTMHQAADDAAADPRLADLLAQARADALTEAEQAIRTLPCPYTLSDIGQQGWEFGRIDADRIVARLRDGGES